MIISYLEAHEIRDMNTIDIPMTHLHTESDEDVIMIFKG